MWYHPVGFALKWRDVIAAWVICFAAAAALLGYCALATRDELAPRAAAAPPATRSVCAQANFSA
jgi:hypothetical protein